MADHYITPSIKMQEAVLLSLQGGNKTAKELAEEGIASERTIRAALSYMNDKGSILKARTGDYGRVYYGAVGPSENGVDVPRFKVNLRGTDLTIAQLTNALQSPAMRPLRAILLARAMKSAAKRSGNMSVFGKFSYDTLKEAIELLEEGLNEVLDLVLRLENTPILWNPDEGVLYQIMGWDEENGQGLELLYDEIVQELEPWMLVERSKRQTRRGQADG